MTVLRSNPGVRCTLRATAELLFSHDSPTSYRHWKFPRYHPVRREGAIKDKALAALPI
jgi:hypothetical protein